MADILIPKFTAGERYYKTYPSEIQAVKVKGEARTVLAAVSTDSVDRDSEVVVQNGIDRKAFSRTPSVLWAHDYSKPPIGKALWTKVPSDRRRLLALTKFADNEMGDLCYNMYKDGYMNAFSIGFRVHEYSPPSADECALRPELANCRMMLRKTELLEYSAVPVPCNPDALAIEVKGYSDLEKEIRKALKAGITSPVSVNVPISLLPTEEKGEDLIPCGETVIDDTEKTVAGDAEDVETKTGDAFDAAVGVVETTQKTEIEPADLAILEVKTEAKEDVAKKLDVPVSAMDESKTAEEKTGTTELPNELKVGEARFVTIDDLQRIVSEPLKCIQELAGCVRDLMKLNTDLNASIQKNAETVKAEAKEIVKEIAKEEPKTPKFAFKTEETVQSQIIQAIYQSNQNIKNSTSDIARQVIERVKGIV
jgi:HK97 family phage prohead protease